MTNELVKEAFRQAIDQKYDYLNTDDDIVFSDDFSDKMESLIRKQNSTFWHMINSAGKKAAVIIIGIIIMAMGSLSVNAVRNGVVEFIKEIYEKYISMTFEGNTSLIIENEYYVSYVPDGYELTADEKNDAQLLLEYSDSDSNIISMTQMVSDGTVIKNDNEHLTNSTMVINNNTVQIATDTNYTVAVWTENSYVIRVEFIGNISLEEAEKVISSVKER